MENPYFRLMRHVGRTDADVARALGRSRQAVARWRRAGIPRALALEAERLTGGAVQAEEVLRFASTTTKLDPP